MNASDSRYVAVQQLSAYWLMHPHASDTLEGICAWWLGGSTSSRPDVEPALGWLVDRRVVVAHRAADGRVRYRLSAEPAIGPS